MTTQEILTGCLSKSTLKVVYQPTTSERTKTHQITPIRPQLRMKTDIDLIQHECHPQNREEMDESFETLYKKASLSLENISFKAMTAGAGKLVH